MSRPPLIRPKIKIEENRPKSGKTAAGGGSYGCLHPAVSKAEPTPPNRAAFCRYELPQKKLHIFDFSADAATALITACRKRSASKAQTPSIVVPAGEQTASFSSPGCRPSPEPSLALPKTVCAANLTAFARGSPATSSVGQRFDKQIDVGRGRFRIRLSPHP